MLKYHLDKSICPGKKRKIEVINNESLSIFNGYNLFLADLQNEN